MQRLSDAEQCFLQDVKEKKKAATGVHSKKGKRGYVGKMLFPTDLMSRKEKYNHRKGGKIVSSNMYDAILSIDDFKELETYEQKNRLQYWRTNNQNKFIMEKMGLTNAHYYDLVKKLGLPTLDRSPKGKREAKVKAVPIVAPPAIQDIGVNGLQLSFNGTFPGEDILRQLTKFVSLLEGEEDHYYVDFTLKHKG